MRCRRAQRWMTAAEGLAPRRRRALERHLAACATCRADGVLGMKLDAALAALPTHAEVPASLEQATLRAVRRLAADEERPASSFGWLINVGVPGLAAAAAVVLAVGLLRGGPSDDRSPAGRVAHGERPAAPRAVARQDEERSAPPATVVAVAREGARQPSLDDPPAELIAAPERFIDMPVLRDLDKLRHYDTITGIDDDQSDPGQVPRSDG